METNVILLGDAKKLLPTLPANSIDAFIIAGSQYRSIQRTCGMGGKEKPCSLTRLRHLGFGTKTQELYDARLGLCVAAALVCGTFYRYSCRVGVLPFVVVASPFHSIQGVLRAKKDCFLLFGMRCSNQDSRILIQTCVFSHHSYHRMSLRNSYIQEGERCAAHALYFPMNVALPCPLLCIYKDVLQYVWLVLMNVPCSGNWENRIQRRALILLQMGISRFLSRTLHNSKASSCS